MKGHAIYRTAVPHPKVARAWGLHQDAVVVSHTPAGASEPTVAVIAKGREQEVLDRAHARYGIPGEVLHIPDKLPGAA